MVWYTSTSTSTNYWAIDNWVVANWAADIWVVANCTTADCWTSLTTSGDDGTWTMGFSQTDTDLQQQCLNVMLAQGTATRVYVSASGRLYLQPEEEIAAREAQRAARVQAEQKRSEAAERARELLLKHLTPEQRETYVSNGWFVVEGGRSKKRYRIHTRTYAGNIDVLDGDKTEVRLCCHCADAIPQHDHHLAQKLMLEAAEDDFLRAAKRRAV